MDKKKWPRAARPAAENAGTNAAVQKKYSVRCAVYGALLLACFFMCFIGRAWLTFLASIGGAGAATALCWALLVRFALCRRPQRYLRKPFVRTLRYALGAPVMIMWTALFLQGASVLFPASAQALDSEAVNILMTLFVMGAMYIAPVIVIACEVRAVFCAWRHLVETPETEGPFYREGPFALALFLSMGAACLCIWLLFYLVL